MNLPYKVEYSKSNRSSCKGCKSGIKKDTLRMAVILQARKFDSTIQSWYHSKCFFKYQRPQTVDDIENFENLRNEDQALIKNGIEANGSSIILTRRGQKRSAAITNALNDFVIQYSKSGRAGCRGCNLKILKNEIRISKKDYETDIGKQRGGQDKWYHLECFAKLRTVLGYFEDGAMLPGFKKLKKPGQDEVRAHLPVLRAKGCPPVKKIKKDDKQPDLQEEEIKKQNEIIHSYRDELKTNLKKKDLQQLLKTNKQDVPKAVEEILNRLCDIMTFGALVPCKVCSKGQLFYSKGGYVCDGNMTGWTKCTNVEKVPRRRKFVIPKDLSAQYPFLKSYKYVKRNRLIKNIPSRTSAEDQEKENMKNEDKIKPRVVREKPPLYEMKFMIWKSVVDKNEIKKNIIKMGGKVVTKIDQTVMAVISTKDEVQKATPKVLEAKANNVHIITEDFLNDAINYSGRIPILIKERNICSWGFNRDFPEEFNKNTKPKPISVYDTSEPKKIILVLRGESLVDPDSGLQDNAHVYSENNDPYKVVLAQTDIQNKKNAYYKMQLYTRNADNQCFLFRSWGRIGTAIKDMLLEPKSLIDAKYLFKHLFEEKTGNTWDNRKNFVKIPGKMYPIQVEYIDQERMELNMDVGTNLPRSLQRLDEFVFDVKNSEKTASAFDDDIKIMPLGKLSKKQIHSGYCILAELQALVEKKASEAQLLNASNHFYTMIPHSFGNGTPPIIKNFSAIKRKLEMLDNFMGLEVVHKLTKCSLVPLRTMNSFYTQLKEDIEPLANYPKELRIVKQYLTATTQTDSHFNWEIVNLYKVKRPGEEGTFKKLDKYKSKKENVYDILTNGVHTGDVPMIAYMFGKQMYIVSFLSAAPDFCKNGENDSGWIALAEVPSSKNDDNLSTNDIGKKQNLRCLRAKIVKKLDDSQNIDEAVGIKIRYLLQVNFIRKFS